MNTHVYTRPRNCHCISPIASRKNVSSLTKFLTIDDYSSSSMSFDDGTNCRRFLAKSPLGPSSLETSVSSHERSHGNQHAGSK